LKKKSWLSLIFKNIEVVFNISPSLVLKRLHTKNQIPRLPVSSLKWYGTRCGGGAVYFTDNNTMLGSALQKFEAPSNLICPGTVWPNWACQRL
jgi:hypothetical protein